MTLNEHYKFHSRKSLKPYASLLLLIVLCIGVFHTFASYSATANALPGIHVAKWSVTINGESVGNGSSLVTQELINADDGTTELNAGDRCYFDIIIDPTSTEVSVSYTILVDVEAQGSTLPAGTTIEKYEKYVGSDYTLDSNGSKSDLNASSVTISDDIDLQNTQTALGSSDIIKYRIYCVLPEFMSVQKDDEISVIPQITIKQKIGNN